MEQTAIQPAAARPLTLVRYYDAREHGLIQSLGLEGFTPQQQEVKCPDLISIRRMRAAARAAILTTERK